jgi:hypothetical protein
MTRRTKRRTKYPKKRYSKKRYSKKRYPKKRYSKKRYSKNRYSKVKKVKHRERLVGGSDSPLPSGWEMIVDYLTGNVHYYNRETHVVVETPPVVSPPPPGWATAVSRSTGDTYYINESTGETQYAMPGEPAHGHFQRSDSDGGSDGGSVDFSTMAPEVVEGTDSGLTDAARKIGWREHSSIDGKHKIYKNILTGVETHELHNIDPLHAARSPEEYLSVKRQHATGDVDFDMARKCGELVQKLGRIEGILHGIVSDIQSLPDRADEVDVTKLVECMGNLKEITEDLKKPDMAQAIKNGLGKWMHARAHSQNIILSAIKVGVAVWIIGKTGDSNDDELYNLLTKYDNFIRKTGIAEQLFTKETRSGYSIRVISLLLDQGSANILGDDKDYAIDIFNGIADRVLNEKNLLDDPDYISLLKKLIGRFHEANLLDHVTEDGNSLIAGTISDADVADPPQGTEPEKFIVNLLLESGCNPNLEWMEENEEGESTPETLVGEAILFNRSEILILLLKAGGGLSEDNITFIKTDAQREEMKTRLEEEGYLRPVEQGQAPVIET